MAEIGVAAGALLAAMRVHRKDIGAVEPRLIGVGIVAQDPIDKLILTQHRSKMVLDPAALQ
jgi:hypothetical protein